MNQRYFVVFFKGNYEGNTFNGNVDIVTRDDMHMNKRAVQKEIEEKWGFGEAIITGFNELSYDEYEEWSE